MAAADATTAMTIDFLRARLLSERSVSRAAKDRADQLANRVAELEELLRAVTAQRRKAERAAADVLAILDSQGFGRFSDAADSGSDDGGAGGTPEAAERGGGGEARGEAEDAVSGSELGGPAGAPQPGPGGLSWKGRAASPDSDRRQPLHKAKQLRQRHGHSHRRSSYFRSLAADSSPKYQRGQSCRKIKRKEPSRLQTEDEGGKDNAAEGLEEEEQKSDCTVCTDEQRDLDGAEASQDGRGSSSGDGGVQDGNERYTVEYEKDGEMERVLEKQAELIGQYEAEENAQREWEKKFSGTRDSTSDDVDRDNKLNQNEKAWELRGRAGQVMTKDVVPEEAQSRGKDLFGINSPSECLLNGSVSGLSSNVPEVRATGKCKESGNDFGWATPVVASVDSELHARKDELVHRSYTEIIDGSGCSNLGRSASSPQKGYTSIPIAGHNKGQGDGNSDSGSSYHANARPYEHYITTPSVGSPLSDTPKSKMSEWSSSCFHNHTDNQIDMQPHQLSSDDIGGVLDALQHAKMSLREKLSRASPPRQDMLALRAPEDHYIEDDLQFNDTQLSLCMSLSQEILALPVSGGYLSRISLPGDDAKIPVSSSGLFRLPTDSFPQNEVCSTDGYGSEFSLVSSQQTIFSRNPASHMMPTSSLYQHGSSISPNPYHDPHSSMLLSKSAKGDASFIPQIRRSSDDTRRGMPS